jgi:hypothetical protein
MGTQIKALGLQNIGRNDQIKIIDEETAFRLSGGFGKFQLI